MPLGEDRQSSWDTQHLPSSTSKGRRTFVVSMYCGLGSSFQLLRISGGGDVFGVGAEIDSDLRQHIRKAFPQVGLFTMAEAVTMKKIWPTIVQSGCSRVLLMAGPPCQPWSSLGPQQGRLDSRADSIDVFANFPRDLRATCRKNHMPFDWLMEEVASMSKESRDLISDKLGAAPVAVNAADWGYVHATSTEQGLFGRLPS